MTAEPKGEPADKLKNFFRRDVNRWHNLYEGSRFRTLHMADRKRIVLELVDKYSADKSIKVLDLGCGTGILTLELLKKGYTVTAFDCTEEMIDRLRMTVQDLGSTSFEGAFLGYAQDTRFPSEQFDAIICIGVFQYQLSDADLVREISRLLKKGGFCVFTLPNLLRLNYLLDPLYFCKFVKRASKIVLRKVLPSKSGNDRAAALSGGTDGSESHPYDKKYFLWKVDRILSQHRLATSEIVGFGYGPPTFFGRQIVSDRLSKKISDQLDKLTNHSKILKLFSNRWAFVVHKE